MAWVFTAMLKIRMLKAKRHIDATRVTVFGAKPINASAKHITMKPTVTGCRLSKRDTNHPETGSPMSELMGIKSSMVPSSASLNSKLVLMEGIREAQLEKTNPLKKKN